MAKVKYKVLCDRMQGTGIDAKKGQTIELESSSDNVKSLAKRGWIEEVKQKNDVEPEKKKDSKKSTKKAK